MLSKTIKKTIRALVPRPLVSLVSQCRQRAWIKRNSTRSPRDVFTDIYRKGKWGKKKGVFYSGPGSSVEHITKPYIRVITEHLQSFGGNRTLVDLGCGDLQISKNFFDYCSEYVGVDVVSDLIEHHKSTVTNPHVRFCCLDLVSDELPEGDVCLLRQVLQHLSNAQIAKILPKLRKYKVCFVTEHLPADNPDIIPNKDIVHGSWNRSNENSGVYLDKPPFDIPSKCLQLVLEVPGVEVGDGSVIRTYKIEFDESV
ncbi:MAG: class I SAM-dependent methyltransferase [Planctomycetes bacterium]|nr:class I SAM-dependent methyltransferase [Planctomycetota bacterium]